MKPFIIVILSVLGVLSGGCMKWEETDTEAFHNSAPGLFIVCEGNFQYGNATLSFYNPATGTVENELFLRANGYRLGDVAQSMVVRNGLGWIVVNNSHVVFAIDTDTYRERGRIENLTSPRYIHFVSDSKAYITQLWDNRIFIADPRNYQITGHITVPGMAAESGSTEQMVQWGKFVFCNCWSYQNKIIKIDTETDQVVDELIVGIQPQSLVLDANGKLWTITDGGYENSPYGYETPSLIRIDAATFAIEQRWHFSSGDTPRELQLDGSRKSLFWLNDDVWTMAVSSTRLPINPLITSKGTIYYGLTVDPSTSEIYVADAIDYQQPGKIYRYTAEGILLDSFYTGVIPGAFAWKTNQ